MTDDLLLLLMNKCLRCRRTDIPVERLDIQWNYWGGFVTYLCANCKEAFNKALCGFGNTANEIRLEKWREASK